MGQDNRSTFGAISMLIINQRRFSSYPTPPLWLWLWMWLWIWIWIWILMLILTTTVTAPSASHHQMLWFGSPWLPPLFSTSHSEFQRIFSPLFHLSPVRFQPFVFFPLSESYEWPQLSIHMSPPMKSTQYHHQDPKTPLSITVVTILDSGRPIDRSAFLESLTPLRVVVYNRQTCTVVVCTQ